MVQAKKKYFQEVISSLQQFWMDQGAMILPPSSDILSHNTLHPDIFFKSMASQASNATYLQPISKPEDARYAKHVYRTQRHYTLQTFMNPSPQNLQELYLHSLKTIGIALNMQDIRFTRTNPTSPMIGVSTTGWACCQNGFEISQIYYLERIGELKCSSVGAIITYQLEKLIMLCQGVDNVMDLKWVKDQNNEPTYGELFGQTEIEMSTHILEKILDSDLTSSFEHHFQQINLLLKNNLCVASYNMLLKACHDFNLLNAKGSLRQSEKKDYIARLNTSAKIIAASYNKTISSQTKSNQTTLGHN